MDNCVSIGENVERKRNYRVEGEAGERTYAFELSDFAQDARDLVVVLGLQFVEYRIAVLASTPSQHTWSANVTFIQQISFS